MNAKKINLYYQYFALIIGILCTIYAILFDQFLLLSIGSIVLIASVSTIIQHETGRHLSTSKLPEDFNAQSQH